MGDQIFPSCDAIGARRGRSLSSFSVGICVFGVLATLLVAVSAPGGAAELPALQGEVRPANILQAGLSETKAIAAPHGTLPKWSHIDLAWLPVAEAPEAAPGSPLTSYLWRGSRQIAYLTLDGKLQELRCEGRGLWTHTDLMEEPVEAPPPAPGSALTSFFWGGYKQIAYLTAEGHVHEICCNPDGSWSDADLLQQDGIVGAPNAGPDAALSAYVWRGYKQIAYLTADGHVQELRCDTSPQWTYTDLMPQPDIAATPAVSGSPLATYGSGDDKQIAYLSEDGHVHELHCDANEKWTHADVSQQTGAAAAAAGSALAACAWAGEKQIVYLTEDRHLHELRCDATGKWSHADLMEQPGIEATVAVSGSPLTGYVAGGCKQFAYLSADGHVHELSCGPSGPWTHADLMELSYMDTDFAMKGSSLSSCIWSGMIEIFYFSEGGRLQELCFKP